MYSQHAVSLPHLSLPHPSVSPRTMGPLPPSAVAQDTQLLIHTVDESINTTFVCSVTNALGTGQAELTVLVRGEEPPWVGRTEVPKGDIKVGVPLREKFRCGPWLRKPLSPKNANSHPSPKSFQEGSVGSALLC